MRRCSRIFSDNSKVRDPFILTTITAVAALAASKGARFRQL
jgi:hypothetical protein